MIYIVTALSAEARLFLDYYKLKARSDLPFKVYENENVKLIVSGVGYESALMATATLLAHFLPSKEDILINIGVSAAPSSYPLGTMAVAHKIEYKDMHYFPDVLFSHNLAEITLKTLDTPQLSAVNTFIDMEAHAVFKAASKFMQLHQMAFLKIVSDHFEPERVNKKGVEALFQKNSDAIFTLINALASVQINAIEFKEQNDMLAYYKRVFSVSQYQQFMDAYIFYFLKYKKAFALEKVELQGKRARSLYLEAIIKQLTQ